MSPEVPLSAPPFLSGLKKPVPCTERPALFHPPDDGYRDMGGQGRRRTSDALALCRICPVMRQCRQWAREQGEFGIWGGETDTQRMASGHRTRVRTGRDRCWEAAALDAAGAARQAETPSTSTQREIAWPPSLAPFEAQVLVALSEGIPAQRLADELARSQSVVMRALVSLQRKLWTDINSIVDVAREAGLLESSYTPAA
ncbi:WhiB family transcriptional regulator [Streptomyces sp. NPDC056632]|uniref:WhiB family transcriptional regulator n=1 Tax=Streptomyces sp. NPDC056632 TaxID=3345884 RepID=UPI00369F90C4